MLRVLRLLAGVALLAALVPAGAGAVGRGPSIEGAWSTSLPERVHGTSVAIGPEGAPWFGLAMQSQPLSIARVSAEAVKIEPLSTEDGDEATASLKFDSQGVLWFARNNGGTAAIGRRDPDGKLTTFPLPGGGPVNALTIGPEGDIWFVRGGYGTKAEARVGRMTGAGAVTQFRLAPGAHPGSITVGPDGALWFTEEGAGKVGRIAPGGAVQLFALAPKAQPRQIVAGPDGALWFGENARARRYGKFSDRIGRITTDGQVSELPVPFGEGTSRLAADPRGIVWFTTDEGELSSISPSGNVGGRGCLDNCESPIEGLAQAPDGTIWFATGVPSCEVCGGGSGILLWNMGTEIGLVPDDALTPADPAGPPAKDPYATGQPKPPPPIARTGTPWGVDGTSAILTGRVDPRGFPASWRFKWGKTRRYGHLTEAPEYPFKAGSGAAAIEELIDGLCPRTTYHFTIVAYGPGGHDSGGDRTFRTPPQQHRPKRCQGH